jgi:hypothetical protein
MGYSPGKAWWACRQQMRLRFVEATVYLNCACCPGLALPEQQSFERFQTLRAPDFLLDQALSINMTIAEHYQQLPSLETARARLLKNGGEALVADVFLPFFQEHKMERCFGLQIAHRHFDVEQDEKVVHYGSCAVPWKASEGMPEPQPTVWAIIDGCARAVEFRHSTSAATELGPRESRFMDAFSRLQEDQGISGLFALCEYPGDDFEGSCEITQDRCNINLKPRDVSIALAATDR